MCFESRSLCSAHILQVLANPIYCTVLEFLTYFFHPFLAQSAFLESMWHLLARPSKETLSLHLFSTYSSLSLTLFFSLSLSLSPSVSLFLCLSSIPLVFLLSLSFSLFPNIFLSFLCLYLFHSYFVISLFASYFYFLSFFSFFLSIIAVISVGSGVWRWASSATSESWAKSQEVYPSLFYFTLLNSALLHPPYPSFLNSPCASSTAQNVMRCK